MDIFEKARELGEMIEDSEEMKRMKIAETLQAEDEEAQNVFGEFNLKRMNLAKDMEEGKISREEAVIKNNEAFSEMLEKSELIKNYIDAKNEFDRMISKINGILNYHIMGKDAGCTHDCSTCSGCH